MSGKYLPLKFAFVLLLAAFCLAGPLGPQGLKFGPDIAGGYRMIFQVYGEGGEPMIERIIAIIKNRMDPAGLSGIEFTPLQSDRFEVRMPAPRPQSSELRVEFRQSEQELQDRNITRSDLRNLLGMEDEQRQQQIRELTSGNEEMAEKLRGLLGAMEAVNRAEETLGELQESEVATQEQIAQAREALFNARADYERKQDVLQQINVSPLELQAVLKIYDQALAADNDVSRESLENEFTQAIDDLKAEYPTRADQIQRVADLYRRWKDVARPLEDPNDVIRMINQSGVLEFRIAPIKPGAGDSPLTPEQVNKYVEDIAKRGPQYNRDRNDPYAWYPIRSEEDRYPHLVVHDYTGGQRYLLLSNQPGEKMVRDPEDPDAWQLASASPSTGNMGGPAVDFTFDPAGAKMFSQLTGNNVDRPMAILLDDEVYSAPNINERISNRGQITGNFTRQEVVDLARVLESGSLPGRVNPEPVSQTAFGPALGRENMNLALTAGIIGLIVVAVFMIVYYLLCGVIAVLALVLNIVLVLGALSWIDAALTLPGIAGIILTIGMAVDANVLIFERLREEQAKNLPVRQALKNAYERAFTAIFDANITTLLICLFLYVVFDWVGMEEVRGFAITLGLGVMFSMFTALLMTRWIFQALLDLNILKKPLPMLRLIPKFNVNWMAKRYYFWAVSIVLVVLGIGSLAWQGKNILGIEFSSGTQADIRFRDDALVKDPETGEMSLPDDGIVERLLREKAQEEFDRADDPRARRSLEKFLATIRVETQINPNIVQEYLNLYGGGDGEITLAEWKREDKDVDYFRAIDADGNGVVTREELDNNLRQNTYQVTTTVVNSPLIRKLFNETFGAAMQRRVPLDYEVVGGEVVSALGLPASEQGGTFITPELVRQAPPSYYDEMQDYEGGLFFAIRDVSPAVSVTELTERIRDVRQQPDIGRQAYPFHVVGMGTPEEGKYSSFLVLVRPAEANSLVTPEARTQFLTGEKRVVTFALEREEAMVLRSFDAAVAKSTAQLAIVVVVLSWLAIVIYLWLRFGSFRWGLAAVLCLVHDVIIVVGLVAVSGWLHDTFIGEALGIGSFKIDLAMVAALLTVIGYSVNDTIVVFDRIRENRGKLTTVTGTVINNSINQTLPRTLLTSLTTFMVVFVMYVWGGSGIHAFNYALMTGIVFGTYSSVAVASPMLLGFKEALVARAADMAPDAQGA